MAEIGDRSLRAFPRPSTWRPGVGICPGNKESGGQAADGENRHGNPAAPSSVVEIAHVASKTKDTYLAAQYGALRHGAARNGPRRLGTYNLVIVYHILTRQEPYRDLGATYFDLRDQQRVSTASSIAWSVWVTWST